MCTSWNTTVKAKKPTAIITYWEMCTSWNLRLIMSPPPQIITYWEMCTSWNWSATAMPCNTSPFQLTRPCGSRPCRRILAIVDYRNRTCLYPVSGLILASLYFAQGYCVNHPPSLSSLKRVHPRRATSKQTALSAYLLASVHCPCGFLPNDPSPHTRSDLFRLPLSVSGRFVVCIVSIL